MTGILIIIPCLNEEKHLERIVWGLLENNKVLAMQIVIVDGGSTDRSADIGLRLAEQHQNVFYLPNPKRLQSAAINLAVTRYGDGNTFLIRVDAHADYPANFCQTLVDEALKMQADSVTVTMNTVGITYFQRAVAAAQNSRLGHGGSAHRSDLTEGMWVEHGHHALKRIEAFRAAGGYDETFSHNEDAEFDIRFRKAGYKIWLTAKTFLTYYPRATPYRLLLQYISFGQGRARTLLKHSINPKLRQILPVFVAPALVLALAAPSSSLATTPFMIWCGLCLGYGAVLGIRDKSFNSALAGSAAMIMHLGWSIGFWKGLIQIPKN